MKTFSMSCYANAEDLYKAKAEYFEEKHRELNGFNKCALSDLNQIKETECSLEAWNLVCNAISFLE